MYVRYERLAILIIAYVHMYDMHIRAICGMCVMYVFIIGEA
jgi:hypothetical protein